MTMRIEDLPVATPVQQVPHAHTLIVTHTQQELAVGVESYVCHPIIVSYKSEDTDPLLCVPDFYCLVSTSTR